jgi:membrane protein
MLHASREFLRRLHQFPLAALRWLRKFFTLLPGLLMIGLRSLLDEQLMLRSMSLVYTTLLSLIPLLAVSFSLVKAFNIHTKMEGIISNALAPLGPAGEELARRVIATVEGVDLGVLGAVGFIFLIYKSIFLIFKIELALNHIWQVKSSRKILRRFGDYIIVMLIGPVLILTALGIIFSLMSTTIVQWLLSMQFLGPLIHAAGGTLSYLISVGVFTFIYMFLPDTTVRAGSALAGALMGSLAWEAAGWIFATFTVSSAEYSAVYSGFAIPILFLMWLYMSWFILLIGARIAFYHQHPGLISAHREDLLSTCRLTERMSLACMFLIGERFYAGGKPWTLGELAIRLGLTEGVAQDVLLRLQRKGLLTLISGKSQGFVPARALETIELQEVIEAESPAGKHGQEEEYPLPQVDSLMESIRSARSDIIGGITLRDLVLESMKAPKEKGSGS